MREAGLGVNVCSPAAITRRTARKMAPELLDEQNFAVSQSFVTRFLEVELGMSYRTATKAAKKVPDNWEHICKEAILRISQLKRNFRVPSSLIINGDQTGVDLFPSEKTYEVTGAKQVPTVGMEDKRHITLMVTSAMDGTLLPFQAVLKGKSSRSLPSAPAMSAAQGLGMHFKCGATSTGPL